MPIVKETIKDHLGIEEVIRDVTEEVTQQRLIVEVAEPLNQKENDEDTDKRKLRIELEKLREENSRLREINGLNVEG
jgi:hypothetical protein